MDVRRMKHIFIIGSKGMPAKYGGFETFVDRLTAGRQNENIKYHVACMQNEDNKEKGKNFTYNNAECFVIKVPNIGSAKAVYYDLAALRYCVKRMKQENISNGIVYVLACRIGPFIGHYKKQLKKLSGELYVNPDGHEWLRDKWNAAIKKYWKFSEKLMVKHADLLVCDSKNIEEYIKGSYRQYKPKTAYIAYGADRERSTLSDGDKKLVEWYQKKGIRPLEYYLVVGRFVPENNYETMICEFMKSNTQKDFVLISNVEESKFYKKLKEKTGFEKDKRIKFVGTVYDQELLKKIREKAFAYFHGHEVGGTNPSLLEALGSTDLNLLLDVGFNREVAEDGAVYWSKEVYVNGEPDLKEGKSLSRVIDEVERMTATESGREKLKQIGAKAHERVREQFSWEHIIGNYEKIFCEEKLSSR